MTLTRRILIAAIGTLGSAGWTIAEETVQQATWPPKRTVVIPAVPAPPLVCPPVVPAPPVCPPQMPGVPTPQPGPVPAPGMPAPLGTPTPGMPTPAPGTPAPMPAPMPAPVPTPGTPTPAATPPATPPAAPPATPIPADPNPQPAPNLNAAPQTASARGTSARDTALPTVFGDLFGGGSIAGPFVRLVNPNGQFVGQVPVVVDAQGRQAPLSSNGRLASADELLFSRPAPVAAPNAVLRAVTPPPGFTFDAQTAQSVVRVPQVVRGTFKLTENDTPRPTTRAYVTYNFYDQLTNSYVPNTPRIVLHQQMFGYEQALRDGRMSVGIRLPYNQLISTGLFSDTSLGDLTFTSKFVIRDNTETGFLLSGGLLLTVPTGSQIFQTSTTSGDTVHSTLFQPFLGYIYAPPSRRLFTQGFMSLIVPTDDRDVTILSNSLNVGYKWITLEESFVQQIIPVMEFHLNTPLNQRGIFRDPVGFVDTFSVLGGLHFMMKRGASIGLVCGAPLTGPRPFSLQAGLQANLRF